MRRTDCTPALGIDLLRQERGRLILDIVYTQGLDCLLFFCAKARRTMIRTSHGQRQKDQTVPLDVLRDQVPYEVDIPSILSVRDVGDDTLQNKV